MSLQSLPDDIIDTVTRFFRPAPGHTPAPEPGRRIFVFTSTNDIKTYRVLVVEHEVEAAKRYADKAIAHYRNGRLPVLDKPDGAGAISVSNQRIIERRYLNKFPMKPSPRKTVPWRERNQFYSFRRVHDSPDIIEFSVFNTEKDNCIDTLYVTKSELDARLPSNDINHDDVPLFRYFDESQLAIDLNTIITDLKSKLARFKNKYKSAKNLNPEECAIEEKEIKNWVFSKLGERNTSIMHSLYTKMVGITQQESELCEIFSNIWETTNSISSTLYLKLSVLPAFCDYVDAYSPSWWEWGKTTVQKYKQYLRGINLNKSSFSGITPLMFAAARPCKVGNMHKLVNTRYTEVVKEMIALGADVNAQDAFGRTTLMHAVAGNYFIHSAFSPTGRGDMVKLLLSNGANPNIKDNKGRNAIDIAKQYASDMDLEIFEAYESSLRSRL